MSKQKAVLLLALLAGGAWADEAPLCVREMDERLRLACYDALHQRISATGEPPKDQPQSLAGGESGTSAMSRVWELDPGDKRAPFSARSYQPNFFLPLHYSSDINREPSSPTHPARVSHPKYRSFEAKLQISLRAKVAEDLLLPGADLWVAYTQRSLWQLWDARESSPFRSTDYQPEVIYVVPIPAQIGKLPLGWNWRMLQLGFAHHSNGQSDPLSRSWNRVSLGAGLERGDFSVQVRGNQRVRLESKDDNPDLTDYLGRGEINLAWLSGKSTLGLIWRSNFQAFDRGSLQFDFTRPVFADQPAGLRWYLQLFHGYGETLLDYNHRQTSLGLGLSILQF